MTRPRTPYLPALVLAVCALLPCRAELLPPGHRPLPPGVHALVGGKVVIQPGTVLEQATIVIRDGLIEAVGPGLATPADARIWEMKGQTIYAGFIEPYLAPGTTTESTSPKPGLDLTSGGINFFGVPGQETDPGQPGAGSNIKSIMPQRRVAPVYSPAPKTLESLRELGFTAANVVPEKGVFRGTSALVALSETNPNRAILRPDVFHHVAFETGSSSDDAYPVSLMGVIAAVRQTVFDARHHALDHADYGRSPQGRNRPPFNPALDALQPVLEKRMSVLFEPGSALMVDRAARVARELDLNFALLSSGQEWRRPDLAGETGAPFIVPLNFPDLPKMPGDEDWQQVTLDQLRAWDWAPENPALLRRQGLEIALTTAGLAEKKSFRKNLQSAIDRGLSEHDALAALTTVPARLCGVGSTTGTIEPGKLANLTVVDGKGYFDPESKVTAVWIDGRHHRVDLPRNESKGQAAKAETKENTDSGDKDKKQSESRELRKQRVARPPLEDRGQRVDRPIESNPPDMVKVEGATLWTCGPEGILENADLIVVGGRIHSVGRNLSFPAGAASSGATNRLVINGRGLHVTPGLIDCHSHSMILGAVNEGTLPSSAMVRIGDVINSESENIHYQLAGGLTVANLLHGSANPIGGQNAVIKLRDGEGPEGLKFADAPPGIKFALGENVKQANWGDKHTTRFPQSRMGVPTFIGNRFTAARQYLAGWERHKAAGGLPPPRDLELEAIGEILEGKRWIHCHSYRQDEILAFLSLMDQFNVRVGTLQHILEGYKVADEIARHGAGASAFADWWAYKFEVYDAIPHAGSLMHDRGVLVSFNSDSSDLARRMNLEAAKAVKFGGTPDEEALKFVTLNPARQLRIDHRVGSLEPGKDGDFVIWSHPPLDTSAVCQETWIEGKRYFDRVSANMRARNRAQEHAALLDKAKKIQKGGNGGEKDSAAAQAAFFRRALETAREITVVECLDCNLHP